MELKRAAVRWSVYRFPVRYIPTHEEEERLHKLPQWVKLEETERVAARDVLLRVYNAEQRHWNKNTITDAGATDVRSLTAGNV